MATGIQVRGPHQFRVQVRRNGVSQSKTFETLREAQEWQRITEGKVTGEEVIDLKLARNTTLAKACDWMLEGNRVGNNRGGPWPLCLREASRFLMARTICGKFSRKQQTIEVALRDSYCRSEIHGPHCGET